MTTRREVIALAAEAADGSALDRLADILLRSDVPSDLREAARDVHSLLLAAAMAGRRNSGPARHRPPGWGRDFARERGALRPRLHANLPVPACDAACPAGRARTLLRAAARHTLRRLRAICAPRASSDPPVQPARRAVYAIDVHELSLNSARRVFEAFGRGEFIGDCLACDAATYRHPTAMHVVIAETMQRALQKEPQVAVILNLAPRLKEGGILVPEAITVRSALYDFRHAFGPIDSARIRIDLGPLLELGADNARDLLRRIKTDAAGARSLPQGCLRIPAGLDPELRLMLRTSVKVFGPTALDDYDSGITYPVHLHELGSCGPRRELAYC